MSTLNGKCWMCGKALPKNRTKFHNNACKDRWHNINNPRGIKAHLRYADVPEHMRLPTTLTRIRPEEAREHNANADHQEAMQSCELGWDGHKGFVF